MSIFIESMNEEKAAKTASVLSEITGIDFYVFHEQNNQLIGIDGTYSFGKPSHLQSSAPPTDEQYQKLQEMGKQGLIEATLRGYVARGEKEDAARLIIIQSVAPDLLSPRNACTAVQEQKPPRESGRRNLRDLANHSATVFDEQPSWIAPAGVSPTTDGTENTTEQTLEIGYRVADDGKQKNRGSIQPEKGEDRYIAPHRPPPRSIEEPEPELSR